MSKEFATLPLLKEGIDSSSPDSRYGHLNPFSRGRGKRRRWGSVQNKGRPLLHLEGGKTTIGENRINEPTGRELPVGEWGCSSVGRASRSQCEGQGFKPPHLHQRSRPIRDWRIGLLLTPVFCLVIHDGVVRSVSVADRHTTYCALRTPGTLRIVAHKRISAFLRGHHTCQVRFAVLSDPHQMYL